jgi:hypothetical protein
LQAVDDNRRWRSYQRRKLGTKPLHNVRETTWVEVLFPHVNHGDYEERDEYPLHLISPSLRRRRAIEMNILPFSAVFLYCPQRLIEEAAMKKHTPFVARDYTVCGKTRLACHSEESCVRGTTRNLASPFFSERDSSLRSE